MRSLQRHQYAEAARQFRSLLDQHGRERALADRARVYLELCDREVRRQPAEPQTVEERITAATAALNNADIDRAEGLARAVLAENPRHDLALYLLASVEARRGALDQALSYLEQAIALSPEARAQARYDPDFEALRDLDGFRQLTEAGPDSPAASRRTRQPRAER